MFQIEYDEGIRADLKVISKADKIRIKSAVENKLATNPVEFGKPLQYSLKGLRRLRVGDYRIIFKIETDSVLILKIGHRREIYG